MTEYAILLTGDENRWHNATAEERAATFARHDRFTVALGERGHTVTGGAELEHSRGGQGRPRHERCDQRHRRPLRGVRGAAGRLLPRQLRQPRRPARRLRHPGRRRRRHRGAGLRPGARGRGLMRFLLLIAYDDSTWPESTAEQRQEFFDAHHAFEQSVYAHGQLVSGDALAERGPGLHGAPPRRRVAADRRTVRGDGGADRRVLPHRRARRAGRAGGRAVPAPAVHRRGAPVDRHRRLRAERPARRRRGG